MSEKITRDNIKLEQILDLVIGELTNSYGKKFNLLEKEKNDFIDSLFVRQKELKIKFEKEKELLIENVTKDFKDMKLKTLSNEDKLVVEKSLNYINNVN